jgi:tRNA (guanine-N7-)-methyltransferase
MAENSLIRSFVRRDSRITRAQREALVRNWDAYALPPCAGADDLAIAFGARGPCLLEIGSGDGGCIIELAQRRVGETFVAVEVYRPGLGRLLNLANAAKLTNVRVSNQDICDLLVSFCDAVFDQVLIFFPDPWPKKRHHKRRLLQENFFNLLAPRVHRHGRVFIATDCESYAASIIETIEDCSHWTNLSGPGRVSPRVNFRPVTKFERKAKVAGSTVYDFILART